MAEANIIALIQARAGSKGVPRKNIRPLAGHPMMAYSILAAQLCDVPEDIAYLEFLLRKSGHPLCDLLDRRFPQAV